MDPTFSSASPPATPTSASAPRPATSRSGREVTDEAAAAIQTVYDSYQVQFQLVTRRARARFAHCDWRGTQQDAFERLSLYRQFLDWLVHDMERVLDVQVYLPEVWTVVKARYAELVAGRDDAELAYTFFNSVSRRILQTRGVSAGQEFVTGDFERLHPTGSETIHRVYPCETDLAEVLRRALLDFGLDTPFRDLHQDAALAAAALTSDLARIASDPVIEAIEMAPTPFYRNKGAYLVGRVRWGHGLVPLVIPLMNGAEGVSVDAVLSTADEVSVVFSFTRSYFHVESDRPRATVEFLRSIMPHKPIDELYTAIGYHKHGKTELYQALQRVLREPDAVFERAEGEEGLVMSVFVLPRLNIVFKVIKDRFGAPKTSTRSEVKEKYHLVFVRDRVGRLADAQEFEGLEFHRDRFAPGLLEQLQAEAGSTVRVEGERVGIGHLYTERRVTPLNLFLKGASEEAAIDVVLDYGQAIKDLAAANIFTGDMLLKNFGVTRHGRVIFYDYDELCLLTECNFRHIPQSRHFDDELAAEPWFHVGERDVFPEEFRTFLLLPGRLGEAFLKVHGDLLDVEFWHRMQDFQAAGEVVDFFPYRQGRRLRRD